LLIGQLLLHAHFGNDTSVTLSQVSLSQYLRHTPPNQTTTVAGVLRIPRPRYESFEAAASAPSSPTFSLTDAIVNGTTRLPLFLVIGAQKSGTTFLRQLLQQHPLLQATRSNCFRTNHDDRFGTILRATAEDVEGGISGIKKEAHFFDMIDTTYRPVDEPQNMSAVSAEDSRITRQRVALIKRYAFCNHPRSGSIETTHSFDVTPAYLDLRSSWSWAYDIMRGGVPFVVVLRDPVSRFHSAIRMNTRNYTSLTERLCISNITAFKEGAEKCKYGGRLKGCIDANIRRGFYAQHLKQWSHLHSNGTRYHVITNNQLRSDPALVLNNTAKWLGLEEFHVHKDVIDALFARTGKSPTNDVSYDKYIEFFRNQGGDEVLRELFRDMNYISNDDGLIEELRRHSDADNKTIEEVGRWYE
jgi:hypothetical protein